VISVLLLCLSASAETIEGEASVETAASGEDVFDGYAARNYYSVRVGYAAMPVAGELLTGPTFGGTYHYEKGHFTARVLPFELGLLGSEEGGALSIKTLRFGAGYVVRPEAGLSPYAGGAVGVPLLYMSAGGDDYDGAGLEGTAFGGVELRRDKKTRFSLEGELLLPFYTMEPLGGGDTVRPASFSIRLGVASTTSRTLFEVIGTMVD